MTCDELDLTLDSALLPIVLSTQLVLLKLKWKYIMLSPDFHLFISVHDEYYEGFPLCIHVNNYLCTYIYLSMKVYVAVYFHCITRFDSLILVVIVNLGGQCKVYEALSFPLSMICVIL